MADLIRLDRARVAEIDERFGRQALQYPVEGIAEAVDVAVRLAAEEGAGAGLFLDWPQPLAEGDHQRELLALRITQHRNRRRRELLGRQAAAEGLDDRLDARQ